MSDHEDETIPEENAHPKVVPQITTITNIYTKLSYLKKGEYDIWAMKMQIFISSSDILCWNIVLKGNSAKSITTDKDGNLNIHPLVTAEEHQQNPIKARFGKNVESKKMQKSLLKQKFEKFKITEEEGLDKGYDKMQKILTQINTLKIKPKPEDVNIKFLRGLPPSWSGIALILKTKGGLEYISFDDLYNKLKFLEIDTKGYSSSSYTLSNAAFVSTAGSSQGNLSYQESGNGGYFTTLPVSPGSSSSKGSLKLKCSIVDDVIYSFFANHEIDQHLVYEDLDQMNKEEFEEYDLKHQMAMLSIKVHRFKKKHGRKIKFNGRENARNTNHEIDQHLVYEDLDQMNKEEFEEYDLKHQITMLSIKEAGKDRSDSKAMVVVNGSIDWDKQTEGGNTKPRSLENFGMIAGIKIESDADSEEFALMGLSTEVSIPVTCPLCCDSKYKLIEKDYQGQREQLNDCVVDLKAHKNAVKILGKQIKCHQKNKLAYEEKIRVLSYELEEKSNILEYRQKLINQAAQEKQELMIKLENEIANQAKWNNSGKNLYKLIGSSMSVRTKRGLGLNKYIGEGELGIDDSKFSIFHTNSDKLEGQPIYNRFASVDQIKAVPPSLTGNYVPPSNIPDIDESQMVYGKKATDSSEIKTNDGSISQSNDSVLFDFSDRSSEPSTNDLQTCDSSVECSQPNHSDHDSTDSISSVSAPASESRDTIVIDCDKQEDFPSVYTSSIETDEKSSKTLCNKFWSFNKESYFKKHKFIASKSCYVCGSYLHLIKDCDLHEQRFAKRNAEGKGILGRRPTEKPVNPNPVFAGQLEKAKDRGIVDSGFSRSMSGNKDKLEDFEDFNGGELTFGGSTGKISGKGTIKTKTLVLFIKNECLVLSKDFPLPDPSMVILSIPRKHNLYTFSLNELALKGPLTCLIAKASQTESTLWHRRLGHVNFKNMNKLVKGTGQAWMFDIDYLTDSLNYCRVSSTNLTACSQGATPSNAVVPIIDEATTQNDGTKSDHATTNADNLDELTKLQALQRKEQVGKEEADQLGLAFPSLNLILGVGSTPIGSSVSAGSTPPVSAGSTPLMSPYASPISADRHSISAGKCHVSAGRRTGSACRPVSAGRPTGSAGRPSGSAARTRVPADIHDGLKILDCPKSGIFKSSSYDEDFSGPDANNLENSLNVSSTITKRIHNIHLTSQVLGDINSLVQTRSQEEGIDYTDVFAPVARIEAIRLFLAFASFMRFMVYQMDVKSAFLYGKITKEVYVTQPRGFEDTNHPKKVYKVVKSLYRLHQAPRSWYERLSTFLLKHRYRRGTINKTLFIKKDCKDIMLVQVYVDDIIFGSTKKDWCEEFETLMQSEFEISSMGPLTFFLGLQVDQRTDGIFIHQEKYVANILKKFDLDNSKFASTPFEPQKIQEKNVPDEPISIHLYRSMIRCLMYLTATRPDIMFAVYAAARHQVTPKTSNLLSFKRIFKYLTAYPKLGLWYPRDSPFDLEAFFDSDYAGVNGDKKSTSGGCQCLRRRLISWQCKKQTIVATSSCKAEYVAAASCCGQWFLFTFAGRVTFCWLFPIPAGDLVSAGHMLFLLAVYFSCCNIQISFTFFTPTLKQWPSCTSTMIIIREFWGSASEVSLLDDVKGLVATIDGIVYTVTEASIRSALQLDDLNAIDTMTNEEIFAGLRDICNIAIALICLSTRRKYNFSSMIFTSMCHNGPHMPLLAHMLNLGEPALEQAQQQDVYQPQPSPVVTPHLSPNPMPTPPRQSSPPPIPFGPAPSSRVVSTEPILDIPSSSRPSEPVLETITSPIRDDDTGGGSFHESLPCPPPATLPRSPTVGVVEEPLTLTSLLALFPTCLQRIAALEAELKATKILHRDTMVLFAKRIKKLESKLKFKKRKLVLSDSETEEEARQSQELDALLDLANAALHEPSVSTTPSKPAHLEQSSEQEINTAIPAGELDSAGGLDSVGGLDSAGGLNSAAGLDSAGGVDSAGRLPSAGISVVAGPTVPTKPSSLIRDPSKGKEVATPSSPVSAPTAKELADQQVAILEAKRQELLEQELKQSIDAKHVYLDILLAQRIVYDKIRRAVDLATAKDHHQHLKRSGETLESSESKKFKCSHSTTQSAELQETTSVFAGSTIAAGDPIPAVTSVSAASSIPAATPIDAVVSTTAGASGSVSEAFVLIIKLLDSPPKETSLPLDPETEEQDATLRKSSRKKSIARRRTLPTSNDDEPAETVSLALVSDITTWEIIPAEFGLGEIHVLTRADGTVKRFSTLRELMYWAGRADLMVLYGLVSDKYKIERATAGDIMYMFVDKKYPLTPETIQRMLNHGLEIDRDPSDLLKVCRALTMLVWVLNCPTFKLEEIVMAMMICLKSSGVHYQCFTVKCGLLCLAFLHTCFKIDDICLLLLLQADYLLFSTLLVHQRFNTDKQKGFKDDHGAHMTIYYWKLDNKQVTIQFRGGLLGIIIPTARVFCFCWQIFIHAGVLFLLAALIFSLRVSLVVLLAKVFYHPGNRLERSVTGI
uniref:Putative ribonuclease H-like domain-containing protein n=1 Tax=Tanacetum cinerariifolium TaxID=118510 RepID=A0A6L2NKJ2_TANCI|nr:putative ribonuclease H-like domain-containing protein [Tanacetum cinerariifolium]